MHELVIIETGHIDARFKHEVCESIWPQFEFGGAEYNLFVIIPATIQCYAAGSFFKLCGNLSFVDFAPAAY